MWSMLEDFSKQLQWPVNGVMQWLEPSDFKDILSAGLHKEQRIAAGVSGGFVLLGQRTSKMTVSQMKELIDFMDYVGAERGVKFRTMEYDYPESK